MKLVEGGESRQRVVTTRTVDKAKGGDDEDCTPCWEKGIPGSR